MRLRAFDIEASSLTADFGIILTFGSKLVGTGKVEVLRIDDYFDAGRDLVKAEKRMLKDISKRMLDSDCWLGHYACYFDVPFINSRLLYHGLPVLPANFALIDTWRISRNRLKLRSNRLHTVQEFLRLEESKNAILPEQWIKALGGHKPSLAYIVEHNRRDVAVLEEAYMKLRPLVLDHPNKGFIDGRGGCGVCGEHKLQNRGFHITRTRKYQRRQCTACGSWSKDPKPVEVLRAA
jgi:uncharacterized protein YprB with RNaseH-like and TPR domain